MSLDSEIARLRAALERAVVEAEQIAKAIDENANDVLTDTLWAGEFITAWERTQAIIEVARDALSTEPGAALSPIAGQDEPGVKELRQAVWDIFGAIGGDQDGDATPEAIVSGFRHVIEDALEMAKETRADLQRAREELEAEKAHADMLAELVRENRYDERLEGRVGYADMRYEAILAEHAKRRGGR